MIYPPKVLVKDTGTPKGRGVFAASSFKNGDVVEISPVVVIQSPPHPLPDEISKIIFDWNVLAGMPEAHVLALGYGCMYNHSNRSNLRYEADSTHSKLCFIAVRDIHEGEELTINYNAIGGGAEWHDNNWFDRMNVNPIANE